MGSPPHLGRGSKSIPLEANVVQRIFEWAADGAGLTRIVERLNAEGVPGSTGKRWSKNAVARILRNERFLGRQIWGQKSWSTSRVPVGASCGRTLAANGGLKTVQTCESSRTSSGRRRSRPARRSPRRSRRSGTSPAARTHDSTYRTCSLGSQSAISVAGRCRASLEPSRTVCDEPVLSAESLTPGLSSASAEYSRPLSGSWTAC
jgi:hypothetical protein